MQADSQSIPPIQAWNPGKQFSKWGGLSEWLEMMLSLWYMYGQGIRERWICFRDEMALETYRINTCRLLSRGWRCYGKGGSLKNINKTHTVHTVHTNTRKNVPTRLYMDLEFLVVVLHWVILLQKTAQSSPKRQRGKYWNKILVQGKTSDMGPFSNYTESASQPLSPAPRMQGMGACSLVFTWPDTLLAFKKGKKKKKTRTHH